VLTFGFDIREVAVQDFKQALGDAGAGWHRLQEGLLEEHSNVLVRLEEEALGHELRVELE